MRTADTHEHTVWTEPGVIKFGDIYRVICFNKCAFNITRSVYCTHPLSQRCPRRGLLAGRDRRPERPPARPAAAHATAWQLELQNVHFASFF